MKGIISMNAQKKKVFSRKFLLFLVLLVILCTGFSVTTHAAVTTKNLKTVSGGTFQKKGNAWVYRYQNGNLAKNRLLKINGKIYYFSKRGYRQYGWKKIQGKDYYFGKRSEGYMYRQKFVTTSHGSIYYMQKNGRKAVGWKTIGGYRYYFGKAGRAYTGKKVINKTTYYFSTAGRLNTTGAKISLSSPCGILINAKTGKIVYGKNETMTHSNASTTKIMTCILALEESKLTEKVTVSANAAAQEPTKLYMQTGDRFYMRDLLYSLMLPSHNDTAIAIAEHVSGSTAKFVKLMNKKAKELGCTNTHFATPNGLDRGLNHYTTASDLAKIAQYAYQNATFQKIVNTSSYSFTSIKGRNYRVTTTNELLGSQPGLVGMKTGYTNKAGYCFVGVVKSKKGNTYISVNLGGSSSQARWDDARKLLNYGYLH